MTRARLALALCCIPLFWGVWGYDLWPSDEPYFAEGAREMLADGRWIVPHVNGVVTTDKPPFFFWLIALASWPFGEVGSLTARFPSFVAALGSLALTWRLGARLYDERVATRAAVVLAVTYMFWDKARTAQTDGVLSFLILVALCAFEAARAGDASPRRAGILFWAAGALAVLTKGPVGILLPLGIAVLTLVLDRRSSLARRFAPLSGPLAFSTILAAWAVPASLWDPELYTVGGALREHFVDRAVHGMHHVQPFWYYAKALPPLLIPWTALVPTAVVWAWRTRDAGSRFLLIWLVFVVVFFSISTEKRSLYVLPSAPAYALLLAAAVEAIAARVRPGELSRRWIAVPQWLTVAALGLGGLGLLVAGGKIEAVPRWTTAGTGALVLVTGAATAWTLVRGRLRRSVVAVAAGFAVTYLFVATTVLPALDPQKSARRFSLVLRRETASARAAGRPVVAYHLRNLPEAFALYTDGVYTQETMDLAVLTEHLRRPEKVYAVIDVDRAAALPADVSARLETVEEARLSRKHVALVHNAGTP